MESAADAERDARVAAVRGFNRFYTQNIGVLEEGLLKSPFSLGEARVLYELARAAAPSAAALGRDLGVDAGYLSRMLDGLEAQGLLARAPLQVDRRQSVLALTKAGRVAFAALDRASRDAIGGLLSPLDASDQRRLVAAMAGIERLLGGPAAAGAPYHLRPHRSGDIGWIVERHGALYAREYGFDATFEALVAEIAAKFIRRYDAERERCWIAERDGERVGSVMLVRQSARTAKLRLLIVEPGARGLGIGARLVAECVDFARARRYRRITLWTQSILVAARHLYEAAGFRLLSEEPHRSFGQDLVGEYWALTL
jgi:DNA-binding MarR family transcriptional regulator/ribosomal protein S18 acetylase RimI-like enzyme